MEDTILKATLRTDNPKKIREAGFTPGVLNGPGTASASVQFDTSALNKVIVNHGSNAKLWVDIDGDKKYGFIKEVQKSPVDRKVLHVAILLVSKDQEVKMMLPIYYHGRDELEHRMLQVQVNRNEIEAMGRTILMPDSVSVDVSKMELGDIILAGNFHLPEGIKILDPENEQYAHIKPLKRVLEEVVEEVAPVV